LSVAELLELAKQIVSAMTGNPNFPNPNPTLAQVSAAINNLETARQDALVARNTAKAKTAIQNQREDEARAMLRSLAAHVENVSGEDDALIISAGMGVKAPATPTGDIGILEGVTFTSGDSDGELDYMWNNKAAAVSYVIEMSTTPPNEANWVQIKTVTTSKGTLTGLTSGQRYWFRVAAIGPHGQQGPWSDISSRVAP
jgi:hypothetical protein